MISVESLDDYDLSPAGFPMANIDETEVMNLPMNTTNIMISGPGGDSTFKLRSEEFRLQQNEQRPLESIGLKGSPHIPERQYKV